MFGSKVRETNAHLVDELRNVNFISAKSLDVNPLELFIQIMFPSLD